MRNYGRFTTSIYRDADFQALTLSQQGAYYMLGLQPEVSAAGTLPLTLRRWSGMAADLTREALSAEHDVLVEKGHIVIDQDTEELLIVKFVKFDGGIKNEKRRPVIHEAACAIASKAIRHRLALELVALGAVDMASAVSKDAVADAQSRFDRVGVELGESVPQPFSATPEGEPPPADDVGTPSPFCSKHPNGTEKPCGACGTAKLRYSRWMKTETARAAERRQAAQNCPDCHGGHWLLDGTKCDHDRRSA